MNKKEGMKGQEYTGWRGKFPDEGGDDDDAVDDETRREEDQGPRSARRMDLRG